MKKILVFLVSKFIKPFINYYVSRPTNYRYNRINIVVMPGVFHPRFFFSTKFLLQTLNKTELNGKSFLELGAGSGLISVFAATKGASVTSSDISQQAIANVKQNQERNGLMFPVIHSNLFDNIPQQIFDFIVINPPYYKKDPASEADHAWYCGENSEYFIKLFSSIHRFINSESEVLMVLSDVCDINLIRSLARKMNYTFIQIAERQLFLEKNYIYRIVAIA